MTSADAMRASDGDREKVVQALQEQVGEGRLTLAEFEQRSTAAYASAKTVGDLRALTNDLPVDPLAPPIADLPSWQQPWPMPINPPWAATQRMYNNGPNPNRRRIGPSPMRRVHPMRIAVAAVIMILAVGLVANVAVHVLFPWGLLVILFFVFASGGRRRRYR